MFYNVENLFDTIDTSNKIDEEFLPDAPKEWNTERYEKKMDDLAHVISSLDTAQLPIIVGVCEIENNIVLEDLISQPSLRPANYEFVWEDGPDRRGIDCALIYNPSVFTPVETENLTISDPNNEFFITRNILYVEGIIDDEVFHLFVNHWPSRRGGQQESEPNRILAANVLKNRVDEIFETDAQANIIIMGDMNDEPSNMSLSDVLVALPNGETPENQQLVNLMYDEFDNEMGTYNFRGEWNMIDNIIVSGALINKDKGLKSPLDNGYVFHEPFMEYLNDSGEMSPNRTYGRSYYGGISDHFPVYMILE
jgi:predicted extracellular nuclease